MRKFSKEILVKLFSEYTIYQTDAIMIGDATTGNKYAKKRINLCRLLFYMGDEGKDELAKLLKHVSPDVRSLAAVYLLKYKTIESLKVLKEVSERKGLVAFEAEEAIKRWKEGNWHLDEF